MLGPEEAADARTAAELRAAARELRSLAEADPALLAGGAEEVLEALAAVAVRQDAAPGGVLVAAAPAIRARRFRAVFVCGLQDGEFPRRPSPEPFLDDDARASLARASGLVLRRHEDVLGEERHLFYACVSRPEEVLFLSFRSSDEEGDPAQASPFVADVRALFTDELWRERGTRLLAEVTWPPATAPTPHELRRAQAAAERAPEPAALGAPGSDAVLAALAARGAEAARGLETFAACGVRWLVESLLKPERAEPDPEPMRRGSLAHAVLEATLRGLRERTGSARLGPDTIEAALAELDRALGAVRASRGRELAGARGRAGAAGARGGPRALPAPRGRVRRRDGAASGWSGASGARATATARWRSTAPASPSRAGSTGSTSTAAASRWCATTRARRSTPARAGRRTAACRRRCTRSRRASCSGSSRPARSTSRSARATAARAASSRAGTPGRYVNGDVVEPEALDAALLEAREAALGAARAMRAGRIRPCPSRCSPNGCAYPGICRAAEEAEVGGRDRAPRFTAEQRAAVEDRSGSALLAANAGSGKTAVMVERFVEAVLLDGVPVGSILALTFTEKAAGELRERVRRRLADLGEDEHARAVDAAWIGTIHGFCARVLRSRPLAAGLDPRFTVLEEAAAARLAVGRLRARARGVGRPRSGARRWTSPPRTRRRLRDIVLGAHETLRSRGAAPRLTIPAERPAPSGAALADARGGRGARPRGRRRRDPRQRGPRRAGGVRAGARRGRGAVARRARPGEARRRREGARAPRPARPTGAPGRPTAARAPTTTRAPR